MNSNQFSYYDYIPNGSLVIDSKFDIVFWNKTIEKLSGISAAEAVGKNILNLIPRLKKNIYLQRIQNILDGGPPTVFSALLHRYLIPCKLKDGSFRTQHTSIIPYTDEETKSIFAIISVQDVTEETRQLNIAKEMRDIALHEVNERKKIEEILRESEQKLKILNANKDKLFSIIGHDLKNPFQAIMSFSEILISDYQEMDSKEIFDFIQTISDASNSAYKLLENLLNWARSQTGRLSFEPEVVDLLELTNEIKKLIEAQAHSKNIALQVNIEPGHKVFADSNALETIIRNLATNAIKFTDTNGSVTFITKRIDDLIEYTVEDSGIGMSEEDLSKLFRIDVNNTDIGRSKEKGTGLGLILCKDFIEKNGGTIKVKSELNKGSQFIFTVPVSK